VICYTKSFHLFNWLFWFVAASRSYHQDSLVRGIAICCTKSVGIPHGGEGGMPPRREGSCYVLQRLIQVCLPRGLVPVCIPPTHPPPALHFVDLTFCPTPAHCTVRTPWPKTPWIEEYCFGAAQFHGMQPFQRVCGFRNS
jgi:hypothetical protein